MISLPDVLMPIADRLKEMPTKKTLIYFLVFKNEVVYVGITENIGQRVGAHLKFKYFPENLIRETKVFDRVFYFEAPYGYLSQQVEKRLISELRPKYNKSGVGKNTKKEAVCLASLLKECGL